jgi:uncharacterized membrane protein
MRNGEIMSGSRLTVPEAAEHFDVAEITIRRRLKSGTLLGEQVEMAQGFQWFVLVEDTPEEHDHEGDHVQISDEEEPYHPLTHELRGQVQYLKDEIEDRKREHDRDRGDWRGELERLHTLMAQQGQTIQALTQTVEALPGEVEQAASTDQAQPLIRSDPHKWISTAGSVVTVFVAGLALIRVYREGLDLSRDLTLFSFIALQWISLYGQLFFIQKKNRAAEAGNYRQRDGYIKWQDRFGMVGFAAFIGVVAVIFLWSN